MKKQGKNPADKRLLEAFDAFNEYSSRLRDAYLALKERAAAIDCKLAEANHMLKKKVEELDNLTTYLNGLLASMPSGVATTDLEGRIKTINPSARRILGIPPESMVGKRPEEVKDREGNPVFSRYLWEEGMEPRSEERRVVLSKGTPAYINSSVSLLRDARNHPIGKVEIFSDITDLMNLRKKVHSLDKFAALGEMAAGIAHEVRNPLNAIEGFARLLGRSFQKEPGHPRIGGYIEKIQDGVLRLDRIVSTFLCFAHPDKLRLRTFLIRDLLNEVEKTVQELESRKKRPSCPIRIHAGPAEIRMEGDFIKLKHALLNLISNGLAALNGSGGISARARDLGREILFRVCDTGCGMTLEETEKIFHPFYTTREEGMGLGLPITLKIVELHAGRVKVWSRKGRGTIFTIILPKKQAASDKGTVSPERSERWQ